jgi:hypothetical protein
VGGLDGVGLDTTGAELVSVACADVIGAATTGAASDVDAAAASVDVGAAESDDVAATELDDETESLAPAGETCADVGPLPPPKASSDAANAPKPMAATPAAPARTFLLCGSFTVCAPCPTPGIGWSLFQMSAGQGQH